MIIQFTADRGDLRLRLDQILVRHITSVSRMSRTRAQSWIADGLVHVDGAPAPRASVKVRDGAAIEVALPGDTPIRETPRAEDLPLDVIYEDDDLIAVNKRAGMVVHPSFRNTSGTVLNAVLWRLRDRPDILPGLVSRLDKDTSGVLPIALSPGAHARMQRDAKAGHVTKEYLAIVLGAPHPAEGTIALPLKHDPADRRRIITADDGAASETRYRVLSSSVSSGERYSLVVCALVTGRTHQLRVHLSARGWPIAGDRLYGSPDPSIDRQALHAWRITTPHPVSRAPLQLEAPLPPDMQSLAARHRITL